MHKINCYYKLIISIIIAVILTYIYTISINGKILLIPFLVCSYVTVGKFIAIVIEKNEYIKIFNKIYVISFLSYWFGLLIFSCYESIKANSYKSILLTIPFWLIGIVVVKKFLFKKKKKNHEKKIIRFNPAIIISSFLVLIVFVIGILIMLWGIIGDNQTKKYNTNYVSTTGYFTNYNVYNETEDGTTYQLTYRYEVNGIKYYVTTTYGTNYIPKVNSVRSVKYNPNNPEEAILEGTNMDTVKIFIGTFFTMGALTFILAALQMMGYFDKFKIDIMGAYIGIILLIMGIGIILLQTGTTMSLIETIKSFGLWIFIPCMFVIVGIYQIIKCLFKIKKDD